MRHVRSYVKLTKSWVGFYLTCQIFMSLIKSYCRSYILFANDSKCQISEIA